MTIRKIGCRVSGMAPTSEESVKVQIKLSGVQLSSLPTDEFELPVRPRDQTLKQTFVSDIDG